MNSLSADINDRDMAVCLVDDDEIMQDLISRYLVRLGCESKVAVDPQKALGIIADGNFDLVLSDLCMPDKEDGLNFIAELIKLHPTLPIAIMSAEMSQSTQDALKSAGAFACLAKPLNSDDLAQVLGDVATFRNNNPVL